MIKKAKVQRQRKSLKNRMMNIWKGMLSFLGVETISPTRRHLRKKTKVGFLQSDRHAFHSDRIKIKEDIRNVKIRHGTPNINRELDENLVQIKKESKHSEMGKTSR